MELFKFTKKHYAFSAVQHAVFAVDKEADSIYPLHYLKATSKRLIGCDGHRLHLAPNKGFLKPGYYEILKRGNQIIVHRDRLKLTGNYSYPNYQKVFARGRENGLSFEMLNGVDAALAQIVRALPKEIYINPKYVSEALINAGMYFAIMGNTEKPDNDVYGKIVCLRDGEFYAVIMPKLAL